MVVALASGSVPQDMFKRARAMQARFSFWFVYRFLMIPQKFELALRVS